MSVSRVNRVSNVWTAKARRVIWFFAVMAFAGVLSACASPRLGGAPPQGWQEEFNIAGRTLTHTGESKFFILKPGFQITLAAKNAKLVITVLDETKVINGITTRVVEEREEINGELYEVARNFYAIDSNTGDAFYFGEEVDFYKNGKISGHAGAWVANDAGNRPGLIMPGTPKAAMKYYQELAPGVAMDRAEILGVSETFKTPAGEFNNAMVIEESSKISNDIEQKTYAPGIGLIQDQSMKLVSFGYKKP